MCCARASSEQDSVGFRARVRARARVRTVEKGVPEEQHQHNVSKPRIVTSSCLTPHELGVLFGRALPLTRDLIIMQLAEKDTREGTSPIRTATPTQLWECLRIGSAGGSPSV
jgi:hypothetical protein